MGKRWSRAGIVVAGAVLFATLSGPVAAAAPSTVPESTSSVSAPSAPMPVREGALGYLATRSATLWLNDRGADRVIAGLPVPPPYSAANKQMATSLNRELTSAVDTPGACLQIIVDGADDSGGLFNYGFFAVERQYCPR